MLLDAIIVALFQLCPAADIRIRGCTWEQPTFVQITWEQANDKGQEGIGEVALGQGACLARVRP